MRWGILLAILPYTLLSIHPANRRLLVMSADVEVDGVRGGGRFGSLTS